MGRIFILEDEQSVNRGISFSLDKAGHQTCACYTMQEAKEKLLQFQPDLVICDINLPDGSGLDFIEWLRGHLDAYIICLTALNQEMDQVLGYEAGADDYITKPFSLSVLLLKIEAFFKRSAKEGAAGVLHSGALRFNQGEMKLSIDDLEVSLSKNEWRLLGLFLNHPKQILSKRQILEHVFDMEGEFVDENTLAVNIRRLREKIEKEPAKPVYIKNVRGLGYVWDVDVK
ncbi:MAG: response regulator transcription factor [Eubacterium sp.]|jgi:two-component system response regulator VicR|nr:response regulator transcription factor [Eubacterium sp.]